MPHIQVREQCAQISEFERRRVVGPKEAHPHTAHVSTACISACRALPWPAGSPDLSPIEHVWSIIGRALQSACDIGDLTRQLDRIWFDIPQEDIRNLYQSMSSRITACKKARGEQTRY